MSIKLHFSRFEFKYILPYQLREKIESELSFFMTLDPYVMSIRNKKYFVRSLYFDDLGFSDYYDKTDGIKQRKKFRIRTYSKNKKDKSSTFLEIKGRYNAHVYKHRTPINNDFDFNIWDIDSNTSSVVQKFCNHGTVLDDFNFNIEKRSIKPVMLIDYFRRPYVSKYNPDFRLTFDDSLHAFSTNLLFPRKTTNGRTILKGYSIVEVKFRHHIPSWFHRIIQSYELRRISVSKYCQGIEKCNLTPNLE